MCDVAGCIRVFNPDAARLFAMNCPAIARICIGICRGGEEQPMPPQELPLARALFGQVKKSISRFIKQTEWGNR